MKVAETRNKNPKSKTAGLPENRSEAERSLDWRTRATSGSTVRGGNNENREKPPIPKKDLPGIEVVMTRRPTAESQKHVRFEPVPVPVSAEARYGPPRVKKPEVPTQAPREPEMEVEVPVMRYGGPEPEAPYRNVPPVTHKDVPAAEMREGRIHVTREDAESQNGNQPRQNHKDVPPVLRRVDNIPVISKEKAYKLRAPIDDLQNAESLLDSVLRTDITVQLGRLIQASPSLAIALRKATTKVRRHPRHKAMSNLYQESEFPYMEDDIPCHLEYDALSIEDLPLVDSLYISTEEDTALDPRIKAGCMIVPDPYLQYLSELRSDEAPRQVYVANDSASLRVVFPLVNGREQVESVIDSGSQIVSMALGEARKLDIAFDPDVQIYMQSANGNLKKSAGLACNVPFLFGEITVYLQVHVIDQPAYKVLLGRPFDILTESKVNNQANGDQTITLKDPNTTRRNTMPTHPRGRYSVMQKVKGPTQHSPRASVPQGGLPATQDEFGPRKPAKRATVEEVRDESEESSDDDSEEEDEAEGSGFHQSSRN